MPNVRNDKKYIVVAHDGTEILPGQTVNIDTTKAHNVRLVDNGELTVLDATAAPTDHSVGAVYLSDGVPDNALGNNGEYWVKPTTSVLYKKIAGVWTAQSGGSAALGSRLIYLIPTHGLSAVQGFTNFGGGGQSIEGGIYRWGNTTNDFLEWTVELDAGTYSFDYLHTKAGDAGITDIIVDGAVKGQVDQYNGATTYNNVGTVAGVVLAAGVHTVRIRVSGTKNGAASDQVAYAQGLAIRRTA